MSSTSSSASAFAMPEPSSTTTTTTTTSDHSSSEAQATGGRLSSGARELLAGMASGVACKVVEYPFDTVKVLQQTQGSRYCGALDCLATTYRTGGLTSFYRGIGSPLIGAMAENATLFVSYGWAKTFLAVNEDSATLANPVPIWKYLVSGGVSGATVAFVLTPVELIKCRMQVQAAMAASAPAAASAASAASSGAASSTAAAAAAGNAAEGAATQPTRYNGSIDCARRVIAAEGVRGLWRGNLACLAREIPGNVAWFGTYEIVLRGLQIANGYDRKADVPLSASALAGSAAGVFYWAVPFPADTIKSKLQTDPRFEGKPFQTAFSMVVKAEGFRGLYRGLGVTAARAAPAHGVLFFAYEAAERQLRKV